MAKGGLGLISLIWSPFKHLFQASGESVQKLGSGAGKIAKVGLGTVEGVGSSFARHSNQAIRGFTRKASNTLKSLKGKSRRAGRR